VAASQRLPANSTLTHKNLKIFINSDALIYISEFPRPKMDCASRICRDIPAFTNRLHGGTLFAV
jgi:hypothetical protein